MSSTLPMHLSPRCTATSKRTREPCRAPAVTGWSVCRFHGARGGGRKGPRNGNYKHGEATKEAVEDQRALNELLRASRATLSGLSGDEG